MFLLSRSVSVNLFAHKLTEQLTLSLPPSFSVFAFLSIILQGVEEDRACPVIMCTRVYPDPVPECQLFPGEVEEPEEEVADEGRERESDRDSAVESTQGSDTSDGLIRPGDKEDALGDLFFPGEK